MDNLTINSTTILATASSTPAYLGYIALLITVVCWGSFFLPVKKFETGDGLFFQIFVSLGIWIVSYIVNWVRNFPKFYALPMLCGLTWSGKVFLYIEIT
jgi:hypothetical protein